MSGIEGELTGQNLIASFTNIQQTEKVVADLKDKRENLIVIIEQGIKNILTETFPDTPYEEIQQKYGDKIQEGVKKYYQIIGAKIDQCLTIAQDLLDNTKRGYQSKQQSSP